MLRKVLTLMSKENWTEEAEEDYQNQVVMRRRDCLQYRLVDGRKAKSGSNFGKLASLLSNQRLIEF